MARILRHSASPCEGRHADLTKPCSRPRVKRSWPLQTLPALALASFPPPSFRLPPRCPSPHRVLLWRRLVCGAFLPLSSHAPRHGLITLGEVLWGGSWTSYSPHTPVSEVLSHAMGGGVMWVVGRTCAFEMCMCSPGVYAGHTSGDPQGCSEGGAPFSVGDAWNATIHGDACRASSADRARAAWRQSFSSCFQVLRRRRSSLRSLQQTLSELCLKLVSAANRTGVKFVLLLRKHDTQGIVVLLGDAPRSLCQI